MNMWLVGAGYWGSKLVETLKKFNINVKVIDIKNGQTIDDIDTLDPVMVATPLWQHHEQVIELLRRGHHVYVEKPAAETTEQVQEIKSHIKPEQIFMVGHLFVVHPQMDIIKEHIKTEEIGDIIHVTSRRLNWGIYQTKTDPLLSLATHDISIIQEVTNEALTPLAAHAWNHSNNSQYDRVWFSGKCGDKITFDIDVSWYSPVRTRQTVIFGTNGQITWDQDTNTVFITKHTVVNNRAITGSVVTESYQHERTPLEQEIYQWLQCLHFNLTPYKANIDAAEAVAKVIDAAKKLL